jgi:hypothetical protein
MSSPRRCAFQGLLHDVGKIGVPDAILEKPDRLTDDEFAIIKRHPEEGYRILSPIRQLRGDILDGVLYHHERGGRQKAIPLAWSATKSRSWVVCLPSPMALTR